MKRKVFGIILCTLLGVSLVACGSQKESKESTQGKSKLTELKIGASPTPHAEILEHVKPELEKEGIKLAIVPFEDYIMPNKALAENEIDANYFQHIPFFDKSVKENDYDFANAGGVHIELMALYSKRLKNITDLKKGGTVLTSNSEADWGRILTILTDAKLIELKDGVDPLTATFEDVVSNPKQLKFKHDVNPELLTTAYNNDEADLIAINANFVTDLGLSPVEDGLLVEKNNSPYANIVAVRSEDKNKAEIKKLMEVLHSKETQDWISEKWQGRITPVSK